MSDHSPGRIDDAEILYRLLLPGHFRRGAPKIESTTLRPVEALGLSVIRARYVSSDDLRGRVLAYARRKNVSPSDVSLAMARCGDIRTIALSDARGYCVYDTATAHDPAHADVCRALAFPSGTPGQRPHFRDLNEMLSEVFTVVRGGLD